jgi:receptor protein-tyrosine kinase
MPEGSAAAALRQYVAVIRRQAWVIILVTVACAAAAVVVSTRQDPVYRASTKIVVGQGRALFGPDVSFAVEPFTQTMTELLQSDVVAERVIREQNLPISAQELLSRIEIESKPDTSVLEVTYDDTDRERAVRVLGELAASFTQLIDEGLGGGSTPTPTPSGSTDSTSAEPVSATVFDPAHLEPGQVSPKPARTLVIATVVGLILGLALAFLRDLLASRVRDQAEAEAAFGAPVVGVLPRGTVGSNPAELELLSSKSAARVRQSFEMLTATVRFSLKSENFSVILVTSGMPEEGKTTVAANLSFALARSGRRVVVVEADTRRPALHGFLQHPPGTLGMLDVVNGSASLDDALVDVPLAVPEAVRHDPSRPVFPRTATALETNDTGELLLLPAGHKGQGAPPILSVSQTAALIANMREYADCIVFDSAPLLLAGDAFPFAQLANEVLVVCRERASSRRQAERVRSRLRAIGVEDFSVVLTEATAAAEPTYDYSY